MVSLSFISIYYNDRHNNGCASTLSIILSIKQYSSSCNMLGNHNSAMDSIILYAS